MKIKSKAILIGLFCLFSTGYAEQDGKPVREVTKEETYEEERVEERTMQGVREKIKAGSLIVFDHSGSMAATLESNKLAVRNFLSRLAPTDPVGFLPFQGCYENNPAILQSRLTPVGTGTRQKILTELDRLRAEGGTDLFFALSLAKQMTADNDRYYIEIFLLTDDQDTCSQKDWRQLLKELQQTKVTYTYRGQVRTRVQKVKIHVISEAVGEAQAKLEELAKATGGKYVTAEGEMEKLKALQTLMRHRPQTQVETHASSAAQDEVAEEKVATDEDVEVEEATMNAQSRATKKSRAEQKKTRKDR